MQDKLILIFHISLQPVPTRMSMIAKNHVLLASIRKYGPQLAPQATQTDPVSKGRELLLPVRAQMAPLIGRIVCSA